MGMDLSLGDLIAELEKYDPRTRVRLGFLRPHSYRGYYDCLAFEPEENVRIGDMLDAARSALDATFTGWKGGEYKMTKWTDCYLAEKGSTGEQIGPTLLGYILTDVLPADDGGRE